MTHGAGLLVVRHRRAWPGVAAPVAVQWSNITHLGAPGAPVHSPRQSVGPWAGPLAPWRAVGSRASGRRAQRSSGRLSRAGPAGRAGLAGPGRSASGLPSATPDPGPRQHPAGTPPAPHPRCDRSRLADSRYLTAGVGQPGQPAGHACVDGARRYSGEAPATATRQSASASAVAALSECPRLGPSALRAGRSAQSRTKHSDHSRAGHGAFSFHLFCSPTLFLSGAHFR